MRARSIAPLLASLATAAAPAQSLLSQVTKRTVEAAPEVVALRRTLHRHPELSNREEKTGARIAAHLRELGLDEVRTGVAGHGVVGVLKGGKPGGVVALRADMDALPVTERTGLPFASEVQGAMHACGHDSHMAVLLGAAQVLAGLREEIPGTVLLLFQPAEEGPPPGEEGGAPLVLSSGALDDPAPEAVFGLHAFPDVPTGSLGWRSGGMMAAVERVKVTIRGKQAHAAYPWKAVDPVVTAAQVITAAQTVVSRVTDARDSAVVSLGVVHGGQRWNIIPDEVVIEGTIRTLDPEVRRNVIDAFARVVNGTAMAHGATADVEVESLTPVTWNDPELTRRMLPTLARAAGGEDKLVEVRPSMGGEDFAFYAERIPSFFFRLGMAGATGGDEAPALHTPDFRVDEAALPVGVRAMAMLALDFLRGRAQK
jgi:amidohydrolase